MTHPELKARLAGLSIPEKSMRVEGIAGTILMPRLFVDQHLTFIEHMQARNSCCTCYTERLLTFIQHLENETLQTRQATA